MYTDIDMGGNANPQPLTRSRRSVRGVLWMIAMAILLFAVLAYLQRDRGDGPAVVQPSAAPDSPSCGAMRDVAVPEVAWKHSTSRIDYDAAPPVYGNHHISPLRVPPHVVPRAAAPQLVVEQAVHNLEHGYVVVWYDARATDAMVDLVGEAVEQVGESKVVVVPWSRGELDGAPFVLSAWGHLQPCAEPHEAAIRAFWNAHGGPNGDAPEKLVP